MYSYIMFTVWQTLLVGEISVPVNTTPLRMLDFNTIFTFCNMSNIIKYLFLLLFVLFVAHFIEVSHSIGWLWYHHEYKDNLELLILLPLSLKWWNHMHEPSRMAYVMLGIETWPSWIIANTLTKEVHSILLWSLWFSLWKLFLIYCNIHFNTI